MNSLNFKKNGKGQGALEYLLLIGGAVLVATIVLITILGTAGSTNTVITNKLGDYQTHISLGAGGGGGVTCGNPPNQLDAGEQCDGTALGGNDCTTIPGGYTGGTLSCNANCTFNVSACTSPPGNPSFASFTASTGAGSGEIIVNWDISNFDAAGPNIVKAWTADPGAMTPAQFDADTGEVFTSFNMAINPSSTSLTGLSPNIGHFIYMKACNTTACVVTPSAATATSSYSSVVFEGESFDGQPGELCLRTVPAAAYSAGNALAYDGGSCDDGGAAGGTNGTSTFTVNIDPTITSPTTFKILVRAFKAGAPAQTVLVEGATLNVPASNPIAWRPVAFGANSVQLVGGPNVIDITLPVDDPVAGNNPLYSIDMVLLTTDTACVPANIGPNFAAPCG